MKAVLVIDIDELWKNENEKGDLYVEYTVQASNNFPVLYRMRQKLKPLPEKLDNPYDEEQGGYLWEESYVVGYNDCLDDILGEENER